MQDAKTAAKSPTKDAATEDFDKMIDKMCEEDTSFQVKSEEEPASKKLKEEPTKQEEESKADKERADGDAKEAATASQPADLEGSPKKKAKPKAKRKAKDAADGVEA